MGGPEGGPLPMGGPGMAPGMSGEGIDMKSSPANGPATPRDDGSSNIPDYNNLSGFGGPPENVGLCLVDFRVNDSSYFTGTNGVCSYIEN